MIDVQNVTKRFNVRTVIQNMSFSVPEGEILAFLGPNGAGKTTTMRMLTGCLPPSEGQIHISGFNCFDSPIDIKRRMGYLPETPPLYQEFTVREYLIFVARLKRVPPKQIANRLTDVLERLALEDVRHRLIGHLSRGYRQRVGLAQALIHDPPVLILDEPTAGLDPKQIIEMRQLIGSLAGSHTIILSTHILPEATAVCERVIILHQGRIVAIDTPDQLSARLRQSVKLSLTINNAPAAWGTRLETFPGILRLLNSASPHTYVIECEPDRDIREDLARFIIREGVGLLELKTVSMSLEDVFLQLTKNENLEASTEEPEPLTIPAPQPPQSESSS